MKIADRFDSLRRSLLEGVQGAKAQDFPLTRGWRMTGSASSFMKSAARFATCPRGGVQGWEVVAFSSDSELADDGRRPCGAGRFTGQVSFGVYIGECAGRGWREAPLGLRTWQMMGSASPGAGRFSGQASFGVI